MTGDWDKTQATFRHLGPYQISSLVPFSSKFSCHPKESGTSGLLLYSSREAITDADITEAQDADAQHATDDSPDSANSDSNNAIPKQVPVKSV